MPIIHIQLSKGLAKIEQQLIITIRYGFLSVVVKLVEKVKALCLVRTHDSGTILFSPFKLLRLTEPLFGD